MTKVYNIPVTYESWALVPVEADNLQEAINKVMTKSLPELKGEYIDDSLRIDYEGVTIYNEDA